MAPTVSTEFAATRVYIPSDLMARLQDLDPVIDADWEDRIAEIMRKMGATERRYAYSQFIEPKGIRYLPTEVREPPGKRVDTVRQF